MGRSEVPCFQGYGKEYTYTVVDAACFHESEYSRNCRGSRGEDISTRLSPHENAQLAQYEFSGNLIPKRRDSRLYYDMSGHKILIIFNHFKFKKTRHNHRSVRNTREGTYEDVRRLKDTFHRLGFIVVVHDDWDYKDIMKYLTDICEKDHSNTSCVAVAVMTHGKGSHLRAADRMYPVSEITDTLQSAPSLAGKPKLFFFQACRTGHMKQKTRQQNGAALSLNADCLVLYSTYEDHYSYREPEDGSWMMQALCEVINAHHDSMNLVQMVTRVKRTVARMGSSHGKQMPVAEYTLRKFLKF